MKGNKNRYLGLLVVGTVLLTSAMPISASEAGGMEYAPDGSAFLEVETEDIRNDLEEIGTDIRDILEERTLDGETSNGKDTSDEKPLDKKPLDKKESDAQALNDQVSGQKEDTFVKENGPETVEGGKENQNTSAHSKVEGTIETPQGEENPPVADQMPERPHKEEQNSNVQGSVLVDKNNDEVEIKKNDKPYLSLGADLSDEQRAMVLSVMGIQPENLSNYDVVYVTNAEEQQYLGSYISSSQIGSRSLSSVVIVKRKKGSGLNISTNNITYCTVGMYKNALTTAGITDADIIVAGPTGISGTAALVGIFKAYQEMSGEKIKDNVVDAALHELVITGQLEETVKGLTNEEVEEFIAYIKSVIAESNFSDEESINQAIDEACEKYGVTLTSAERQKIVDLLLKITSLGIDLNGLVDYAASLYNSFKNGEEVNGGVLSSLGDFFSSVFTAIGDFFRGLFS